MSIDVTIDRDKYIGGSDIPIIMGLSSFRTRWQLLLEKAGIEKSSFGGNEYTEYGDIMEPQIRDYINTRLNTCFKPTQIFCGDDIRLNMDGYNDVKVLEIKTTSHIYDDVNDYEVYLAQLLFYMNEAGADGGILAVYERPDDFDVKFNPKLLYVYDIHISEHTELVERIYAEIDRFRADLKRLKENSLLTEEDFQPAELVAISNKMLILEARLSEFKVLQEQYDDMKDKLYQAMVEHDVKSWETLNGTKITRVDPSKAEKKVVIVFDEAGFREDYPDLYESYCHEEKKTISNRRGYVKITLPKGE